MDLGKLAPWNWFKKEEEEKSVPVARKEGRLPTVWNEPVAAFERIHRDFARMMDRLFDDLGLPLLPPTSTGQPILSPRVDIRAGDEEYTLSLELPGLDEKSVDVELSGDTLTVKAEKKREEEKQEGGYYCVERSFGLYRRTFSLPEDADRENIGAKMKNGVLTVTIPRLAKPAEGGAKKVNVAVG